MSRISRPKTIKWALYAGLWGAGVAYLLTRFIFQLSDTGSYPESSLFLWLIPFATFLAGACSWAAITFLAPPLTVTKGALSGVFIAWIAHPILAGIWWVFTEAFTYYAYRFVPENWSVVLLQSLLYTSWLTIPLGGILGGVLAHFQLQSQQKAPAENSPLGQLRQS